MTCSSDPRCNRRDKLVRRLEWAEKTMHGLMNDIYNIAQEFAKMRDSLLPGPQQPLSGEEAASQRIKNLEQPRYEVTDQRDTVEEKPDVPDA